MGSADRIVKSGRLILCALLILVVCGASQPQSPIASTARPMVGFSFIPSLASDLGFDPNTALAYLLRKLCPDVVRLPIYWDAVAPTAEQLDFASVDALLATVASFNRKRRQGQTEVILVTGARNLAWPEVHIPDWLTVETPLDLNRVTSGSAYSLYLKASFIRYAHHPLLYAWQVENEPLDNTNEELGEVALPGPTVADEVSLLKTVDAFHPVVVTTYNSASVSLDLRRTSLIGRLFAALPGPKPAGHPAPALQLGDILGLDVYVDTPSTPLREASVSERIDWKTAALTYWAGKAAESGKRLWITEMQAGPWNGEPGFSTGDLLRSAREYSRTGAGLVLLWGVEAWLEDPTWMSAGQAAVRAMRQG
jgi:hypothetical protein